MTTSRIKFVLCLVLAFGSAAVAGPLNPPAGPVTSTYKTLVEVEPRTAISAVNTPANPNASFVITQPGSYYLTGDITVPSGKSGIQVYAYGVTVDLNGFTIRGSSGLPERHHHQQRLLERHHRQERRHRELRQQRHRLHNRVECTCGPASPLTERGRGSRDIGRGR